MKTNTAVTGFRDLVASVISIRLGRRIHRQTPAQKFFQPGTDFEGVPGWTVRAVAAPITQLGVAVDQTVRSSEVDKSEHAVTILARRGYPLGKAFAVMEFSNWLGLLAAVVPAEELEAAPFDPNASTAPSGPPDAPQTAPGADPSLEPGTED
jgi:hypothetical protein